MSTSFSEIYTPNGVISSRDRMLLRVVLIVVALLSWHGLRPAIFPSVMQIVAAIPVLWTEHGLHDALKSSLWVNIKALVLSTAIALPLAWLSRVPAVAPVARAISMLRFLSPAVFFLILLFTLRDAGAVKLWMLVLGEVFFLVTGMTNVVLGIPNEAFDEARVLRMSPWVSVWYVIIRGTLADALELIRDNAAIGWSMLMMVEGFVRSEGGIGVLLLNQEKYLRFDLVYATAIVVLVVGIGFDAVLRWVRSEACPHTRLG